MKIFRLEDCFHTSMIALVILLAIKKQNNVHVYVFLLIFGNTYITFHKKFPVLLRPLSTSTETTHEAGHTHK